MLSEPEALTEASQILERGELPPEAELRELLADLHTIDTHESREAAKRLAQLAVVGFRA